jgi:uncharacterized membrane protein
MDTEVVFLHFNSIAAAESAMDTITTLTAEGFLELDQAAIVSRGDDGWVSVEPAGRSGLVGKTTLGGVLGAIVGGLIGLPAAGAVVGAGAAAKKSLGNEQFDELMDAVGRDMTPGTAVLALTVAELNDPESVADRLELHRDGLVRAEIPESLRAQLDAAEGTD